MHLLSCRYPLKQEARLLQRAPSTMGTFMQYRSWLSVVLPGLIYVSLGMSTYAHAAISEPNKKLFSSAMKAARSGDEAALTALLDAKIVNIEAGDPDVSEWGCDE